MIKFETSVFSKDKIINTDKKKIILVGKSNVGKSSFINCIYNQKKLAKSSSTPGKTKCINYYNINDEYYVCDLPGYGYSTMSKSEKESINKLVDYFLGINKDSHIFMLVDIRHAPTKDDKIMYDYLDLNGFNFDIIATKYDKIPKTKVNDYTKQIMLTLFTTKEIIPFSSDNKFNKDYLLNMIKEL